MLFKEYILELMILHVPLLANREIVSNSFEGKKILVKLKAPLLMKSSIEAASIIRRMFIYSFSKSTVAA
jgi:hypothetical protein